MANTSSARCLPVVGLLTPMVWLLKLARLSLGVPLLTLGLRLATTVFTGEECLRSSFIRCTSFSTIIAMLRKVIYSRMPEMTRRPATLVLP